MLKRAFFKNCTWQLLGMCWFMTAGLVIGADMWHTFLLSASSIPAGSVMYVCHEWIWNKFR